MGVIGLVEKNADVYYNGIYIYRGSGNIHAGGWGVRARDQSAGTVGVTHLSLLYGPPLKNLSYVSFRVLKKGVPATDKVVFSIWKKTASQTYFTRVYSYIINQAVIQAQYGSSVTFADDTIYTIKLPTPISITAEVGYSYYVAVYSSGCKLDYDTDGSINGTYYVAADISFVGTYAISSLTLSNRAVSFECFSEPDTWTAMTNGGAISDEDIDWQNATYCLSQGAEWGTIANIYDGNPATAATSVANGDELYIDVSGDNSLPTGTPWNPAWSGAGIGGQVGDTFPDYTKYGVRALSYIKVDADMGASGNEKILVQVNDHDVTSSTPWTAIATGWQTMYTITGTNAVSKKIYVPVIARWVRFVKAGADTNQCDIKEVEIHTIQYAVSDGDFPVNMVNSRHHCWVENYPTQVRIMKAAVKNMAGATGTPGIPFTNRENVD